LIWRLCKYKAEVWLARLWRLFGKLTSIDYPCFEVRHPRCVLNKSDYTVYAYTVKHDYIAGGMIFTICKAQLHVSATNVGHLQVVQWKHQSVIQAYVGGIWLHFSTEQKDQQILRFMKIVQAFDNTMFNKLYEVIKGEGQQ
jgi:hypothetical protein